MFQRLVLLIVVGRVTWTIPPAKSTLKSWTQTSKQTNKNCLKVLEHEQNSEEFQGEDLEVEQGLEKWSWRGVAFPLFLRGQVIMQ